MGEIVGVEELDCYLDNYLCSDENYKSIIYQKNVSNIKQIVIKELDDTQQSRDNMSNDSYDERVSNDESDDISEEKSLVVCPTYVHFNCKEVELQPVNLNEKQSFHIQCINDDHFQIILKSNKQLQNNLQLEEPIYFDKIWLSYRFKCAFNQLMEDCKNSRDKALIKKFIHFLTEYKDIACCIETSSNTQLLKCATILHILNHLHKCKKRIQRNNQKILEMENSHGNMSDTIDKDFCDQGFNKTRVLVLLPTRQACFNFITTIALVMEKATPNHKITLKNKKRFDDEYGPTDEHLANEEILLSFPDDHQECFKGNIDDNFRIGLELITKTYIKLYSSFKASDIIIASPLGLKTLFTQEDNVDETNINDEEEIYLKDYDCLSSIELLIIDEVFMLQMQNWEHLIDCIKITNNIPSKIGDTDFSRVYRWACDDHFKAYRQTIVLNRYETPEMISLIQNLSQNYEGSVIFRSNQVTPFISNIITPISIIFHGYQSNDLRYDYQRRFDTFITSIFSPFHSQNLSYIGIFVPNYLDYTKLRNYFIKENIKFAPITEYTDKSLASRFRTKFKQCEYPIMVFTERYFFYNRPKLNGIKHLIFYQLPKNPHLFPHIVNLINMEDDNDNYVTTTLMGNKSRKRVVLKPSSSSSNNNHKYSCHVLYSNYDGHTMRDTIGIDMTKKLIFSNNTNHVLYPNNCT